MVHCGFSLFHLSFVISFVIFFIIFSLYLCFPDCNALSLMCSPFLGNKKMNYKWLVNTDVCSNINKCILSKSKKQRRFPSKFGLYIRYASPNYEYQRVAEKFPSLGKGGLINYNFTQHIPPLYFKLIAGCLMFFLSSVK